MSGTPADLFASIESGGEHTCGVTLSGTVRCWGRDDIGQASPPSGTFDSVSVGDKHSCGVRPNGTVECWGSNLGGRSNVPEGLTDIVRVQAAYTYTCAQDSAGMVTCWGKRGERQLEAPDYPVGPISGLWQHMCATVPGTSDVVCWGNSGGDRTTPRDAVAD